MNSVRLFASTLMIIGILTIPTFTYAQVTISESETPIRTTETFKDKTASIVEAIPEPVREKTTRLAQRIETWRVQQATVFGERVTHLRAEINNLKKEGAIRESVEEPIDNSDPVPALKPPLTYVKLVFFEILYFILKIKAVFYILGVLIALSILRHIIKRIRHGSSEYD